LQVAWTFDSGDSISCSENECNPIVVNGVLYATTPKNNVVALDAATGRLCGGSIRTSECGGRQNAKSRRHVLVGWEGAARLRCRSPVSHSLDAQTGKPVGDFGDAGPNDLRDNLGREPKELGYDDEPRNRL